MTEPDFACNDSGDKVRVRINIPKLKAKTGFLRGKTAEAKNAMIGPPDFRENFFSVVIRGEADLDGKTYKLAKNLKRKINPGGCYIETEDGFVNVFLAKQNPNESWEGECRNGLDE